MWKTAAACPLNSVQHDNCRVTNPATGQKHALSPHIIFVYFDIPAGVIKGECYGNMHLNLSSQKASAFPFYSSLCLLISGILLRVCKDVHKLNIYF